MKECRPDETIFMLGKSGGAVVCFLSLLKEEYQYFPFLLTICERLKADEDRKYFLNLHTYVREFCLRLVPFLDKERIMTRLKHIQISTTKLDTCISCIPRHIEAQRHTPETLAHLIDLVCASCYVPIMSRAGTNPFCYTVDNNWVFDGAFLDLFFEVDADADKFQRIQSEYSKFTMPTRTDCIEMYYSGFLNPYLRVPTNRNLTTTAPFETIPVVFSCVRQLSKFVKKSTQAIALLDGDGVTLETSRDWKANKPIRCVETSDCEFKITSKQGSEHLLQTKSVFVPTTNPTDIFLLTPFYILKMTDLKSPPHII